MTRMHAREMEASAVPVKAEQAAIGDEAERSAGAVDVGRAHAWRADEINPRHQRAARVLGAEQDDLGNDVVEIACAERPGEARSRVIVVADADQVDVALAVDLPAGQ